MLSGTPLGRLCRNAEGTALNLKPQTWNVSDGSEAPSEKIYLQSEAADHKPETSEDATCKLKKVFLHVITNFPGL